MPALAKNIFCFLLRRARNGKWYGGMELLADLCGSSRTRVCYAIARLEELGLIAVERPGPGKRSTYTVLQYHDRLSNSGTLGESQTVEYRNTLSNSGTDLSNSGMRMRERTSEKRESTLSESENALSQKTKEAEKEWPVVPVERRPTMRRGNARRHQLHRAVMALFYPSRDPETQCSYVSHYVSELRGLRAKPDELENRRKRWKDLGHDYACTLKTLVQHWDELAPPPPNPYSDSGETDDDRA